MPFWWARVDLNYRPHAYQACALTRLSYRPAIPIRYNLILRKRNEDGDDPAMFVRKLTIYIPRISKENNKLLSLRNFLRKEVIQPQVPLRLPCYDFTPVADLTVVGCPPYGSANRLRVKPTPMVWRAVCTRPGNVFTVACWSTITSDSNFMLSSCREQSELRRLFGICSRLPYCFPLSPPL